MPATGVDGVADELYALSPRDFTAARDARAAEATRVGDKETARQIKQLRRPTVTAWLANQLVRHHRDEVGPLLELGAALREATATLSGPQLRQLSRQRHEVVQALVRQARRLAAAAGQPVSEDAARSLEDTLNAALADSGAGEQLMDGRLTGALQHSGFAPASGSPAASPASPPTAGSDRAEAGKQASGGPSVADRRRAERRERAERDLAEAWSSARSAADARAAADRAAAQAEDEAASARRRLDELRAELETAERTLGRATAARDEATAARRAAHDKADRATGRVTEVQRRLDQT